MKKVLFVFGTVILAVLFVACETAPEGEAGEQEEEVIAGRTVPVTFTYTATGLYDYDEFLRTSRDLLYDLDRVEFALANVIPIAEDTVRSVMDVVDEAQDLPSEFQAMYATMQETLEERDIRVYVTVGSSGRIYVAVQAGSSAEPDIVDAIEDSITGINTVLGLIVEAPERLASAVDNSVELVQRGRRLIDRAPDDFTGLNATKLPAVTASMTEAVDNLTQVPDKVGGIVDSAEDFIGDLERMAM